MYSESSTAVVMGITGGPCWKSPFVVLQLDVRGTSQCVRFDSGLSIRSRFALWLGITVPTKPVGAYAGHGKRAHWRTPGGGSLARNVSQVCQSKTWYQDANDAIGYALSLPRLQTVFGMHRTLGTRRPRLSVFFHA